MGRNYGQVLRRLLEPAAVQVGADFNTETMWIYGDDPWERAEFSPETVAFGLLHCGGQILAAKTHSDEFPAHKSRVARKGSKLLLSVLGEYSTITACTLLARAQALLAVERMSREGDDASASGHRRCADFLMSYFPLDLEDIDRQDKELDESFAHARSLRGQVLPDHAAPEALAAQNFQQWTTLHALDLALGDEFMDKNVDSLILPGAGWDAFVAGHADAAGRWNLIEERRTLYVQAGYDRGYF